MASEIVKMTVILVLMMLSHSANAQFSGCTDTLMGLFPCLDYVTEKSSRPTSSCCSELADIVKSNAACLCAFVTGSGPSLGFDINQTLALALPAACNVQTPPAYLCYAYIPAPWPAGPLPAETPETGTVPGPPANAPIEPSIPRNPAEDASEPAAGGASTARITIKQILLAIFISSFAANFIRL